MEGDDSPPSLLELSGAGWSKLAVLDLLGSIHGRAYSLYVVDFSGVENRCAGSVDRMDERDAYTKPAVNSKQQPIFDNAVGPSTPSGEQDTGQVRTTASIGLGANIWIQTTDAGELRR